MSRFKSILAATDFSRSAHNAVCRAALLASEHGAKLSLVHVVAPEPGRLRRWLSVDSDAASKITQAQASLRQLAAELASRYGVSPTVEVLSGDTVEALNRARLDADLLVVGGRRQHPLGRWLFGRTQQRLVAHCTRPVLVVKQWADSGYFRVLMPINFTPASDVVAPVAARLARGIDLQLFHAYTSTGESVMRETDVSETIIRACRIHEESALLARMRRSMQRVGLDTDKLSFAVGRGPAMQATLRQARGYGADVLVAATPRRGRFPSAVMGDINRLLINSWCDLLLVPAWVRQPPAVPAVPSQRSGLRRAGMGGQNRAHAPSAYGSSWMTALLPADAFMAAERERPSRAGG